MKARRVKKLDPKVALVENAARIISVRLDEMLSFAPGALEPDGVSDQHDMRIAAKRLRYILEATGFCFGKPAKRAARRARDIQDLLGELHDCDVMLPRIEAHVAELRAEDARAIRERAGDAANLEPDLLAGARHRTAYRGLEVLAVYVQARRQLHFDRFLAFWAEQERAATWEQLDRTVERQLIETREHRRAERSKKVQRKQAEQEQLAAGERLWRGYAERPPPELSDRAEAS